MTPVIQTTNTLALAFYQRDYPRTPISTRIWMLPGRMARNAWDDACLAVKTLTGEDPEAALVEQSKMFHVEQSEAVL